MATAEEVSERIGDMTTEEIGDVLDALCSEWGVASIRDGLVEAPVRAVATALADARLAAAESSADDIRAAGWNVAVHNDYRLHGKPHTFWLFTHAESGRFVKGEGASDAEALREVRLILALLDPATKTLVDALANQDDSEVSTHVFPELFETTEERDAKTREALGLPSDQCLPCGGSGRVMGARVQGGLPCPNCGGSGKVKR